jgi:hypothetical protein
MFEFLNWLKKPFVRRMPSITAFCMKCRGIRNMKNAREVQLKNGRVAQAGRCEKCDSKVSRIGGLAA